MSMMELQNSPVTFTICGKPYQVQRLSISEIWATAEQSVVQEYYKSVQAIASGLTGADKMAYLKDATKDVPRGIALQEARADFLSSVEGAAKLLWIALNKFVKIAEQDVIEMIINDPQTIELVIAHIIGSVTKVVEPESTATPAYSKKN